MSVSKLYCLHLGNLCNLRITQSAHFSLNVRAI